MEVSIFDIIGIVFFLAVTYFIYQKGWFFSFYSFFKFLLVFIVSFTAGLVIAPKITHFLPLTNLQFSLIVQGVLFIILWKLVSFKKVFFLVTDKIIPVNRFVFTHHIDKLLNIFPSVVVAFFFTFFIFTSLVAASTKNLELQYAIESSNIVKPLAYKVYSASINTGSTKLFEGVAFNLTPSTSFSEGGQQQTITHPSGGTKTFTPDVILPTQQTTSIEPNITQPIQQSQQQPIPTQPIPTPTATRIFNPIELFFPPENPQTQQQPTQAPQQPSQNENTQPINPAVVTPTPTNTPTAPIIEVINPAPLNIGTVEQDIFRLTNEERQKNGLAPFIWDEKLAGVARAHSQDMSNRNYFNHVSPEGISILGRMQQAGISVLNGGENIAGGPTADLIVTNWMNSPGHRANILNPAYTKLGVGVATSSQYGLLATQNFSN